MSKESTVIRIIVSSRQLYLVKTVDKPTVCQAADKVSNRLVNMLEHLEAEEPDVSLRNWWDKTAP